MLEMYSLPGISNTKTKLANYYSHEHLITGQVPGSESIQLHLKKQ